MQNNTPLTYSDVGDDYDRKDPIKKFAQTAAADTAKFMNLHGMIEFPDSRGESAYVWRQGSIHMAAVIEGLGTKNMVADAMRKITGKTYYEIIGYETIATIINDLITVGAKPLVTHAYWAVGSNDWFQDEERLKALIDGWRQGCEASKCTWGGGESPTLTTIVHPEHIDLGGSSVGIIDEERKLLSDKKLEIGDRIILLKSTGVNANGLSLARAVADRMPDGYATKLPSGAFYGEAVLNKTNIYASLIQDLFAKGVNLHYTSNITGHGLRKIMRARGQFTYRIEKIFDPQEVFLTIQKYAGLDDFEMYQTYNMGMDYALFMPAADVDKALGIIESNGFQGLDAGVVEAGEKQVILEPKNITYNSESMDLR